MCLGKDIRVMQVKTAVANVAWTFDVELVEGHAVVEPKLSADEERAHDEGEEKGGM
jgi:hypothetical protein